MESRAEALVALLGLAPHPEGGHYRELFRSPGTVSPEDGRGARAALTTIYYLLAAGERSRWHRVRSDEVWHHYEGDALELLSLDPADRSVRRHLLGAVGDGARGEGSPAPVHVIPAGTWQAARPLGAYTLAGCSVGPGFDFADFEFLRAGDAEAARLLAGRPELEALLQP